MKGRLRYRLCVPVRSPEPFHIEGWTWDADGRLLDCAYRHGDEEFVESFGFPSGDAGLTEELACAFDLLTVAAGVSYYKVAAAESVVLSGVAANDVWPRYVGALYDDGMREFSFTNNLPIPFAPQLVLGTARRAFADRPSSKQGALVPMGGGRDSLLVAYAVRSTKPLLFTVGRKSVVVGQAEALGCELVTAERRLDERLFELNRQGALNGHVPVTSINSGVAMIAAIMHGRSHVLMSNEQSADAATRIVNGVPINHQFSKSGTFEQILRASHAGLRIGVSYCSVLRRYGELAISQAIGSRLADLPPFLSCNRAFVRTATDATRRWCGECAKCRFVFLGLAPFTDRERLVEMFGRDLLIGDADIAALDAMLLGADRSFDCIGTERETAAAVHLAAAGAWQSSAGLVALSRKLAAVPEAEVARMLAPGEPLPGRALDHYDELVADVLTPC